MMMLAMYLWLSKINNNNHNNNIANLVADGRV